MNCKQCKEGPLYPDEELQELCTKCDNAYWKAHSEGNFTVEDEPFES